MALTCTYVLTADQASRALAGSCSHVVVTLARLDGGCKTFRIVGGITSFRLEEFVEPIGDHNLGQRRRIELTVCAPGLIRREHHQTLSVVRNLIKETLCVCEWDLQIVDGMKD